MCVTEITFNSVLQAQQLTDLEQKLTVAKKEMEIASLDNVRTFIIYYKYASLFMLKEN